MDPSICAVTPEAIRQRGAEAHDRGLTLDDHGMNPWVPAVGDWRKGWLDRRAQVCADQILILAMGMTPP